MGELHKQMQMQMTRRRQIPMTTQTTRKTHRQKQRQNKMHTHTQRKGICGQDANHNQETDDHTNKDERRSKRGRCNRRRQRHYE